MKEIEVIDGKIYSFGVYIESRYGRAQEYACMINMLCAAWELCIIDSLKAIFYDGKSGQVNIEIYNSKSYDRLRLLCMDFYPQFTIDGGDSCGSMVEHHRNCDCSKYLGEDGCKGNGEPLNGFGMTLVPLP